MRSSQIRILLMSLLAVFAISAVASASASAQPHWWICKKGGTEMAKCTGGSGEWHWVKLPLSTRVNVKTKGGVSKLKVTGGPTIECKKVKDIGWIENPDNGEAGIDFLTKAEFTECKVVGAATCEVKEPIVVENVKTKLGEKEGKFIDTFTPEAAEELFTKITIKKCAEEVVEAHVTGKVVALVNGANAELEFTNPPVAGSTLKFGAKEAIFEAKIEEETEAGEAIDIRNP
jgi:hypothetical protein